jgi:hypothetical protein
MGTTGDLRALIEEEIAVYRKLVENSE